MKQRQNLKIQALINENYNFSKGTDHEKRENEASGELYQFYEKAGNLTDLESDENDGMFGYDSSSKKRNLNDVRYKS